MPMNDNLMRRSPGMVALVMLTFFVISLLTNIVGPLVLALAGPLPSAALPRYPTAIVSLFLIGAGMAALQVAINPLLRAAGGEEHYAFNSVLAPIIFGGG